MKKIDGLAADFMFTPALVGLAGESERSVLVSTCATAGLSSSVVAAKMLLWFPVKCTGNESTEERSSGAALLGKPAVARVRWQWHPGLCSTAGVVATILFLTNQLERVLIFQRLLVRSGVVTD